MKHKIVCIVKNALGFQFNEKVTQYNLEWICSMYI